MKNLLIVLALFLSACAHIEPLERPAELVELDDLKGQEVVIITEDANLDYGPPTTGVESDEAPEQVAAEPILALDLFPALYHSLGYVSTFQELEKRKLKAHIISSSGFTSIIAALYAKYGASNMVEWKTFELYQKLGKTKVYSENWRSKINEFLLKEFGSTRLNELEKVLVIPSAIDGGVKLDPRKKIVDAIMDAIDLSERSNLLASNRYNYLSSLKQYGADIVFRISFLPDNINFNRPDGYIFGIYSRLRGSLVANDYTFNFSSESENLDSIKNMSDLLSRVKENNEKFAAHAEDVVKEATGNN
ncbi:MAG: hypothetical protein KC478_15570 [Bacteriovoracaceae bacterium]|nr:hypothetical protein [Bacteriovoracaceae bacterium]